MHSEFYKETVVYKEFRGFCYGVIAAICAVLLSSTLTQSSICFTAHKTVSINKIPDCNCNEPPLVLPAPEPLPLPAPHRPKKDGKLGSLNQ